MFNCYVIKLHNKPYAVVPSLERAHCLIQYVLSYNVFNPEDFSVEGKYIPDIGF